MVRAGRWSSRPWGRCWRRRKRFAKTAAEQGPVCAVQPSGHYSAPVAQYVSSAGPPALNHGTYGFEAIRMDGCGRAVGGRRGRRPIIASARRPEPGPGRYRSTATRRRQSAVGRAISGARWSTASRCSRPKVTCASLPFRRMPRMCRLRHNPPRSPPSAEARRRNTDAHPPGRRRSAAA